MEPPLEKQAIHPCCHICAHASIRQELLNQSSHYSEKVRKQALGGLSDLFTRHPEELKQHTHAFFVKLSERVRPFHTYTECAVPQASA